MIFDMAHFDMACFEAKSIKTSIFAVFILSPNRLLPNRLWRIGLIAMGRPYPLYRRGAVSRTLGPAVGMRMPPR